MTPKICGIIAAKSVQEAYSTIETPQAELCDLFELRLDYLEWLNLKEIAHFLEILEVPVILTLRSAYEGGRFGSSEKKRVVHLKELIQLHPDYIDLETHISERDLESLTKHAEHKRVKTILSTHFFANTPPTQELIKCIELGKELRVNVAKVVAFARQIEDNDTILAINEIGQDLGVKTVAFCMGSLGLPSRLLCIQCGAPFTYAALDEKVAPGQLNTSIMRKFYELLQERCSVWK